MTDRAGLGNLKRSEWEPSTRQITPPHSWRAWRGGDPGWDTWEGLEACLLRVGRDWGPWQVGGDTSGYQ